MQWLVGTVGLVDALEHFTAHVAGLGEEDVSAGLMLCISISRHDNSKLRAVGALYLIGSADPSALFVILMSAAPC